MTSKSNRSGRRPALRSRPVPTSHDAGVRSRPPPDVSAEPKLPGESTAMPVITTPRPVVADMTATSWSLAVETAALSMAIQAPPPEVKSPATPQSSQPAHLPTSEPSATPIPVLRFRLSQADMRSSRHRRRDRGHTFPRAPYSVDDFIDLTRPDGRPWLAATRLRRVQELYEADETGGAQVCSAQEAFDEFFRHVGGRMAAGPAAIILSPHFDMPYIRLAEEVAYAHRLSDLLVRVLVENPGRFRDCELLCFVGEFRHWYGWNRGHFAKDLWDEHRLRNSARRFRNAVFGWHHRTFHKVALSDRARLFWPLPDGWSAFEVNRVLGVPSPSVAHYAATAYHATQPGSVSRQVLDRIFLLEYMVNVVFSHAQACSDGVFYTNFPDKRVLRTYARHPNGVVGRLFRLPPRLVEEFSRVHPFFFLESSGVDPVRAFLALRRAQEYTWDDNSCAAVGYDFVTGELFPMPAESFDNQSPMPNHPGETRRPPQHLSVRTYERCVPTLAVSTQSTLRSCTEAWNRFKTLSRGCSGFTSRVQICREISYVLNEEGFGIETPAITARRKTLVGAGTQWDPICRRFDVTIEAALNAHVEFVATLPADAEDGGLSEQASGVCDHPPGIVLAPDSPRPLPSTADNEPTEPPPPVEIPPQEAQLEDEFYGPPPDWLPESEGYHELEAAFRRLQAAHRGAQLAVPDTVCAGLDLGVASARQVSDLTAEARRDKSAIDRLSHDMEQVRRDLREARAEVTRLSASGSSSDVDVLRGQLAACQSERDAARAAVVAAGSARDEARRALVVMTTARDESVESLSRVTAECDDVRASLVVVTEERDAARAELSASQAALSRVRGELAVARTGSSGMQTVQAELDGVREELTAVQADLTAVRADLVAARTARAAADRRATRVLSTVQSELSTLVTDLNAQVQEVADGVGEEVRKAFDGEGSSNPNKRLRR